MNVLAPVADACPQCHPGDHPAVLPFLITRQGVTLRAWYRHGQCGTSWDRWWNAEEPTWPVTEPVTPERAALNRAVLMHEVREHEKAKRGRSAAA